MTLRFEFCNWTSVVKPIWVRYIKMTYFGIFLSPNISINVLNETSTDFNYGRSLTRFHSLLIHSLTSEKRDATPFCFLSDSVINTRYVKKTT